MGVSSFNFFIFLHQLYTPVFNEGYGQALDIFVIKCFGLVFFSRGSMYTLWWVFSFFPHFNFQCYTFLVKVATQKCF